MNDDSLMPRFDRLDVSTPSRPGQRPSSRLAQRAGAGAVVNDDPSDVPPVPALHQKSRSAPTRSAPVALQATHVPMPTMPDLEKISTRPSHGISAVDPLQSHPLQRQSTGGRGAPRRGGDPMLQSPSTRAELRLGIAQAGLGGKTPRVGDQLIVFSKTRNWRPVEVVQIRNQGPELKVHYRNFDDRYDEWIPVASQRLKWPPQNLQIPPSGGVPSHFNPVVMVDERLRASGRPSPDRPRSRMNSGRSGRMSADSERSVDRRRDRHAPCVPGDGLRKLQRRTIVFIRHAESIWNHKKNTSNFAKSKACLKGLKERAINTDAKETTILDSPLSRDGISQALNLRNYLARFRAGDRMYKVADVMSRDDDIHEMLRAVERDLREEQVKFPHRPLAESQVLPMALRMLQDAKAKLKTHKEMQNFHTSEHLGSLYGDAKDLDSNEIVRLMVHPNNNSVIVASNLRRSISTVMIALWERLEQTEQDDEPEQIRVLSCLQEVGSNADTHSQTAPLERPTMANSELHSELLPGREMERFYATRLDASMNRGNKTEAYSRRQRLMDFCNFVFKQNLKPVVVASGHSGWMRAFYDLLLPPSDRINGHPIQLARRYKQENCCVTAFNLEWDPNYQNDDSRNRGYSINPLSVRLIYGHFRIPKKELQNVRAQKAKGNILPAEGNIDVRGTVK